VPKPKGVTGPSARTKVFSVESAYGGVALVRASSAAALKETLDDAKRNGVFALLERIDGEDILLRPEHVFLVGEPMASTVQT